jgi:mannose-6-phosphate isomerase-like protein (cupin superfamily)
VQLTQSDRKFLADDYTDDSRKIIASQVNQHYAKGATIVWSRTHDWFPTVRALCREVQTALHLPCLANVYLSPPSKQGFNAHYDSHDVFIVQVSGQKTFRFYKDGVILPYSYEGFDAQAHQVGELTEEIELSAGDTLYIPRGMMHDAVSARDETSLHITLGVYTTTYKDLLQKSIELLSQSEKSLRGSIDSILSKQVNAKIPADFAFTSTQLNSVSDEAFSMLHDQLALDAISANMPGSKPPETAIELNDDTRVRVDYRCIMNWVSDRPHFKLRLFSKILEYQEDMAAALEWIVSSTEFSCAQVPMETKDQRIALCEQLLREDVLTLVD